MNTNFARLLALIETHWGIRGLRPLQELAMRAVLDGRDSLVVMPTGGGKSLCYQAPPLVRGDTTVVLSPLIALMKDQVDGLRESGIAAVQIDSSLSAAQRHKNEEEIRSGGVRLVFAAPERLMTDSFQSLLRLIDVRSFAIDEAHCISHWGHDFRPEYRQLSRLKEMFPKASVHGYTATATERVRNDIVAQLKLTNPEILIGDFDRANLIYRVVPRERDVVRQVMDVIGRHANEGGIIYCIRRRDVDELAGELKGIGVRAVPYHAGMDSADRKAAQDAFIGERCDVVVATVAFGMGIDRSNVRFVLHTGMPKSVEHYQQESGRAGRDGLEAECVLLHTGGDVMTWNRILERSVREATEPVDPLYLPEALRHVEDMAKYCRATGCRHKVLVEYFGQSFTTANCGACDRCQESGEANPDALVTAQKILSCVARVKESFGINQVIDVLRGSANVKVLKHGHEKLSTFGLLKADSESQVRDWINQLIDQEVLGLEQKEQYSILRLNPASWDVMRGSRGVRLVRTVRLGRVKKSRVEAASWEGVDQGLFEALRELRKAISAERALPAYQIFTDRTLRELAKIRPSSVAAMRTIHGVGEVKLAALGERFVAAIREYLGSRT